MKYYESFLKLEVFNFKEAQNIVGKAENTKVLLNTYVDKGLIKRIRRDLYYAVNLENRDAQANRYVIASKINESSYLAFHSAFEVYGLSHQTSFVLYVESDIKFSSFSFEGIEYKYAGKGIHEGIICSKFNDRIMLTDKERTVIESLKRPDYCGGLNELNEILKVCPVLDQGKLLRYLEKYDMKLLYKKAGYYFEKYQSSLGITSEFLDIIEKRVGNTRKYLSEQAMSGNGKYIRRWGLIVPQSFERNTEMGDEFV